MLFWPNQHRESGTMGRDERATPSLKQTVPPVPETEFKTERPKSTALPPAVIEDKFERTPPPSPSGIDPIKAGLSSVAVKRFKEAIPRLESAMKKQIPDSLRSAVIVGLLESYVGVKRFVDAQHIASTEFVNDGYYHLLCGKAYFALGKFDRAVESFGNAQTIPSKRSATTLREAANLWAKTLYEIYTSKPNAENKRAALRAWQQFSKAFCGDIANAGQCDEAVERILELGK
jgi:tetratricopeptide (TPR) repeat protein